MLGSVFENDGKNDVLSGFFRLFKTENETTSFRLVVWFENEIVDVVLINRFQKLNEMKRKFHAKTFFFSMMKKCL